MQNIHFTSTQMGKFVLPRFYFNAICHVLMSSLCLIPCQLCLVVCLSVSVWLFVGLWHMCIFFFSSARVVWSLRTDQLHVNNQPVNDSHLGILFTRLTGILKRSHCPLLSSQPLKLSIYSFSHVWSRSIFSSQKISRFCSCFLNFRMLKTGTPQRTYSYDV